MRLPRTLDPGEGCYHVTSRISGQRFLLNENEKDILAGWLFRVAEFSGVTVLTFAMLDNHFHIMVKVPRVQAVDDVVDDVELVRRMRVLYDDDKTDRILSSWETWEKKGLHFKVVDAKAALRCRMYDLSQFCKTFKETYSMSYNARNAHSGTIWGSRFTSSLLSKDYQTLMTIGAYIELNSVRARIVEEPDAYRWSGVGMAKRGHVGARNGIRALVAMAYRKESIDYETAIEAYESAIEGYIPSAERIDGEGTGETAVQHPQTFKLREVEARIKKGEKLTLYEMLRCKVRHFSHGLAVGPAEFVHELVHGLTPGKDTVRRCDSCDEVELFTARWLRGDDKVSVPKRRGVA